VRLFVSLRLPSAARTSLAAALAGARTTDVGQWHVTLAFLGDVPDAGPLAPALAAVADRHPPLQLRVRGGGAFARVWWGALDGDVRQLRALAADVTAACRDAGVGLEDRPYRPHVTVARRGSGLHPLEGYEGPVWTATEVELVRSHLGATARHEVLDRFALSGGGAAA
jgi:RNA 2',3'-cyclic 3'-phosphodiesterase